MSQRRRACTGLGHAQQGALANWSATRRGGLLGGRGLRPRSLHGRDRDVRSNPRRGIGVVVQSVRAALPASRPEPSCCPPTHLTGTRRRRVPRQRRLVGRQADTESRRAVGTSAPDGRQAHESSWRTDDLGHEPVHQELLHIRTLPPPQLPNIRVSWERVHGLCKRQPRTAGLACGRPGPSPAPWATTRLLGAGPVTGGSRPGLRCRGGGLHCSTRAADEGGASGTATPSSQLFCRLGIDVCAEFRVGSWPALSTTACSSTALLESRVPFFPYEVSLIR